MKERSLEFPQSTISSDNPLWRHQMVTFPLLFPSQRPVTRSFGVFFNLRLNKRLSGRRWFETPSPSFWRHWHAFLCPLTSCDLLSTDMFTSELWIELETTDLRQWKLSAADSMPGYFRLWNWLSFRCLCRVLPYSLGEVLTLFLNGKPWIGHCGYVWGLNGNMM